MLKKVHLWVFVLTLAVLLSGVFTVAAYPSEPIVAEFSTENFQFVSYNRADGTSWSGGQRIDIYFASDLNRRICRTNGAGENGVLLGAYEQNGVPYAIVRHPSKGISLVYPSAAQLAGWPNLGQPQICGITPQTNVGGFLYRAVQGHSTIPGRVVIERNIVLAYHLLGVRDADNNVAGDGWALMGRTNGASSNGTIAQFYTEGAPVFGSINSVVPYVRINNNTAQGPRCITASPIYYAFGLNPAATGQTRIMEGANPVVPGACS